MIYSAEYTITIKIDKIFMPPDHTEEELQEEIKSRSHENLRRYFNDIPYNPKNEILNENISSYLKIE